MALQRVRDALRARSVKGICLTIGIIIGACFSLFEFGLAHDVVGPKPFHHLVDRVTFFAPMLTFTIAIAACCEQILLHHTIVQAGRFRAIFMLNIFTAALVTLACSSLVRLDLAAISDRGKRTNESAVAQATTTTSASRGKFPIADANAISKGTSENHGLSGVCRDALSQWFCMKTSRDVYDPRIHLTITFFLFALFVGWDTAMRALSLDDDVKQEIRAASYALNVPTLLGLGGMVSLAVFGFTGLSRPEQDAFIGGIIAFHLAFAAMAFLISVVLPSGSKTVAQTTYMPNLQDHDGKKETETRPDSPVSNSSPAPES